MKSFLIFTLILVLCSCAATYRPINPKAINYSADDLKDGISISYNYDVLRTTMNNKYAKKEQKKNVRLIAVKITNNTDTAIVINSSAFIYAGENLVNMLSPYVLKHELGQAVPTYIFYALLSLIQYQELSNGTVTKSVPIGLAIGVPIMIGNMVVAGSANKKFRTELTDYDLNGKKIENGETVIGLIGIRDFNYLPLTIKRK